MEARDNENKSTGRRSGRGMVVKGMTGIDHPAQYLCSQRDGRIDNGVGIPKDSTQGRCCESFVVIVMVMVIGYRLPPKSIQGHGQECNDGVVGALE